MQYCSRCLYPANHPLNIVFDGDGVCSGCRIHEEKDRLDWDKRKDKLRSLVERYRNRSSAGYDCIVPVSGARDSYFIVDVVRRELGLNPLLVSYNRHYNTRRGHRNLAYLRTIFDLDIYTQVIQPQTVKKITRETLRLFGSMYWHVLAGQTVWPVQVAVRYKIPLIIWGHHQGLDQVGMFSHTDEVEMTRKYRKDHDLMGFEAEDVFAQSPGLKEDDLQAFYYPHDKELAKVGVRGIYLGNYIRWDTKRQHEAMIDRYDYESALQQRTFDTYNDVDCVHYSGLHDFIKFLKHGYGKVTDHAVREIRFGRLTRDEGIALIRQYQTVQPSDLQQFLVWIGLSEKALFEFLDAHRDPRLWRRDKAGGWELTHSILDARPPAQAQRVLLPKRENCVFRVTPSRAPQVREDEYVLIDRGYVDGVAAKQ
ncbi:MAG: N-acetyl sugar amidotransferase [Rhodospirillaceae bacterium]|nr:MAG: N-acetyl sugar amidotransferase [Rhodospirillaceae bacterium]